MGRNVYEYNMEKPVSVKNVTQFLRVTLTFEFETCLMVF